MRSKGVLDFDEYNSIVQKFLFFFFLEVNQILKSEKKTHCRRVQTIRVKILVVVNNYSMCLMVVSCN